jgi:hypothetical protein
LLVDCLFSGHLKAARLEVGDAAKQAGMFVVIPKQMSHEVPVYMQQSALAIIEG